MASDLIVPVVRLTNFREHPNASLLGLVDVLGYQMVIPLVEKTDGPFLRTFQKGKVDKRGKRIPVDESFDGEVEEVRYDYKYNPNDLYVYFAPDTLIPAEWADKFGVRQYLKGSEKDRVGRIKLRGEPSFGLVVEKPDGEDWEEGDNVADFYGATKYEPPIRASCGDVAKYDSEIDPYFEAFTDIQNGRIFTEVFTDGEEVIVTEKLHGTNSRFGIVNGNFVAASMSLRRKRPVNEDGEECSFDSRQIKSSTYWFPWSCNGVESLIRDVYEKESKTEISSVILYGEIYGGSIQSLDYGIAKGQGLGFRAFGLRVNGDFMDWPKFEALCDEYGVEVVPVLYRGPYDMGKMKELADGKSTMANHIREGIVVYPVEERTDPKVGRAVVKIIGTEYELSKHKAKDNKDL